MLNKIISTACADLRGDYAKSVIRGYQRWSGADLRGKAKKYSYSYGAQRVKARIALYRAGGCIVTLRRQHGLNVTGVQVAVDDFGTAVYDTTHGLWFATDLR